MGPTGKLIVCGVVLAAVVVPVFPAGTHWRYIGTTNVAQKTPCVKLFLG